MAKATLIHYTGANSDDPYFAARMLVLAKSTRLELSAARMQEIENMSKLELANELAYIARTIPSSWEFVHFTFLLEGVSRACAQQITRTRTASFAMQSQRVNKFGSIHYALPNSLRLDAPAAYDELVAGVQDATRHYHAMLDKGAKPEDARAVLPLATSCNILMNCNLRTLSQIIVKRSSPRVQEEYRSIVQQMKQEVLDKLPYLKPFFDPPNKAAVDMAMELSKKLKERGLNDLAIEAAKIGDKLKGD